MYPFLRLSSVGLGFFLPEVLTEGALGLVRIFPSTREAFGELPFSQASAHKAASVMAELTLTDHNHCLSGGV